MYRRAGAVVIDDDRVLLVSLETPNEGRWWLFPGGGIEAGESAHQAAVRELFEETGLRARSAQPYLRAGIHGGEHDYFLAECDDLEIGAVSGPELDYLADADFRAEWVPIDRLATMPVFPRCVAEHVAEHGAQLPPDADEVPWYEDDRSSWHGIDGARQPPHVRFSARTVVIDGGRIAAIERVRDGQTYFTLPGGGLDAGETVEQAVIRETKEELGLDVIPRSTLAVVLMQVGDHTTPLNRRVDRITTSHQSFVWCEVVGGEFGTGHGSELTSDAASAAGSYRPMWLDVDDLPAELRPAWLADRLPAWIGDPAPARPERFTEQHL